VEGGIHGGMLHFFNLLLIQLVIPDNGGMCPQGEQETNDI